MHRLFMYEYRANPLIIRRGINLLNFYSLPTLTIEIASAALPALIICSRNKSWEYTVCYPGDMIVAS